MLEEKPRAEILCPELTRLPNLHARRRLFRRLVRAVCWLAVKLLTRTEVHGLENFPKQGPALLVTNHLGDADGVVGVAFFPREGEALAKVELYQLPVVGKLMDAYGVIWVHRGQPDLRAVRAAVDGLKKGRVIGIAPEGRESLTGALEEATNGAAYIALKAGVPLLPVTFTGTENANIFGKLKRLRRPRVTMTVGPLFRLEALPDRKQARAQGTERIMRILANQLPAAYRGVYTDR